MTEARHNRRSKIASFLATFDLRWIVATLSVVCVVLATGYVEDHRSCERQLPVRKSMKDFIQANSTFQSGLSQLDKGDKEEATIIDPATGQPLNLTRLGLRKWIQAREDQVVSQIHIPQCDQVLPDK